MIMLNSSKADVTVIHICASCLKTTLNILSHLCQELTELFSFSLPQIQRTFERCPPEEFPDGNTAAEVSAFKWKTCSFVIVKNKYDFFYFSEYFFSSSCVSPLKIITNLQFSALTLDGTV